MAKKKVDFMCTAFRDGLQSVFGARVFSTDIMPVVAAASQAGLKHFEAGGGARFQSLYFYLNEDAFTMMDAFRMEAGKDANLQTLARGINVVGLDSQPRDIIDLHAKLFARHGITTIRNFDALNDVDNLIYSGQAICNAGLKHEITVTMMRLPPGCKGAHTPEFYMGVVKKILESGIHFDSICFKDASGTATPAMVYETMVAARKSLPDKTRIVFHTHDTAGLGIACYLAALEGGVDQIDLSLAPVSHGTSNPDVVTMWHALRDTDFDLGIDIHKVLEVEHFFKGQMKDYFMPPEALSVEALLPFSPMPGGALTANTQMMRDANIMDRYPDVIAAMGEVVLKGGFGTSVTPVSQFYFQQAFNNVMFGPFEKIAKDYGRMVLGYFGKTPAKPDRQVVEAAREQLGLEPTTQSPLDINDANRGKGIEAAKNLLKQEGVLRTEENIFIAATCGQKGITFLKGEAKLAVRKKGFDEPVAASKTQTKADPPNVPEQKKDATQPSPLSSNSTDEKPKSQNAEPILAQMPGNIVRIVVKEGQEVQPGDLIFVQENMLTQFEIFAPKKGTLTDIQVQAGDQVEFEQVLGYLV